MIHQLITGVRPPYRGRGLGKWLKAANLHRMRRELPQVTVVVTGIATTNAAMLSINERLGFCKHKEGIMAQLSLEALEEYLNGGAVSRVTGRDRWIHVPRRRAVLWEEFGEDFLQNGNLC